MKESNVAHEEVLFEWRDRDNGLLRLVKTFSPNLRVTFTVEVLSKDAVGQEKWDKVKVITLKMVTFDWLYSFVDTLRQKVWEK